MRNARLPATGSARPTKRPNGAAGRREEWTGSVVNPPVWRASTHLYADTADLARGRPNEDGHFYYGRRGTPTTWALEAALMRALGITASLPEEDRHSYTKDWLEGQLTMLYGGRVAEEMDLAASPNVSRSKRSSQPRMASMTRSFHMMVGTSKFQ